MALPSKEMFRRLKACIPHGNEPRGRKLPRHNRIAYGSSTDAHGALNRAAGNGVCVLSGIHHAPPCATICGARQGHDLALARQSAAGSVMLAMDCVPYPEIAARLMALRQHFSDLSQKDWAERHGFNRTQYNNWEKGVRRIPVEAAEKLCDRYGLTLDAIYRGRLDGLSENARNILSSALPM